MKRLILFAVLVAALVAVASATAARPASESGCSKAQPCANPWCAEAGYGTDDCYDPAPEVTPPVPQESTPDGGPAHTKLCYSHFSGSTPWTVLFSDAPELLARGETIPIAVSQAEAVKRGIPESKWERVGDELLVCTIDGLTATGDAYNGDDPMIYSAAWVKAFKANYVLLFNLYLRYH